jgi:hypothetical protein
MLSFAALGAFANWMRLKYGADLLRAIERFVDEIANDFRVRVLVQIALFVVFGAILSVKVVEPKSKKQAVAAGILRSCLEA